jgi:hypothetical protein
MGNEEEKVFKKSLKIVSEILVTILVFYFMWFFTVGLAFLVILLLTRFSNDYINMVLEEILSEHLLFFLLVPIILGLLVWSFSGGTKKEPTKLSEEFELKMKKKAEKSSKE